MLNYTKIVLLFFALVPFSVRTCVQDTNNSEVKDIPAPLKEKPIEVSKLLTADESSFKECSKVTRGVLITHCGICHQSTLNSHKTGAIQIFDLDMGTNWHTSLSEENLPGIAQRTQNKNIITKEQKEAIATFLKLKELQLKE